MSSVAKVKEADIHREIPPEKAKRVMDHKEARLLRFVHAYLGDARRNKIKALDLAGDEWGNPVHIKKKAFKEYLAARLYEKAVYRGLINPKQNELLIEQHIPKERVLDLLSRQATGEKPSKRSEVLRRNSDNGELEVIEVRSEYDEQAALDKVASILGLYKEIPKPIKESVGQVLDKLEGEEKRAAEDDILKVHLQLLEEESK